MSSLFQLLVKVCVNKWKVQVSQDTRLMNRNNICHPMNYVFKEKHFIHLFIQIKMFNKNSPTCDLVENVNIVERLVVQC